MGLDKPGGIIQSVARVGATRLSNLPGLSSVSQRDESRPAGLGNYDNSCYQNSVLQGLASLDSLTGYLTNPKIDIPGAEVENSEMRMAGALKGLIATLNDPENNGCKIWTPATLKNMSSWQQQDAQEYFSKVLDEIDKEIGKVANRAKIAKGLEADNFSLPNSKSPDSLPMSTFRNPLEGLIAQRVGCTKCGFSEGLSMIPFNCLTVPLSGVWGHNIAQCLDEYTKLEYIEGVECGKCTLLKNQRQLSTIVERTKDSPALAQVHATSQSRLDRVNEALEDDDYEDATLLKCGLPSKNRVSSTKSRQAVIARPPKSLVVHINRSLFDENTGELRKNGAAVRFPKYLDLASWCLGSAGAKDEDSAEEWLLNPEMPMVASSKHESRVRGPTYEIRGVVTHFGRHENGHYVCYRKRPVQVEEGEAPKEQWWRMSDEDVSKVSEQNVLDQGGVFMLFYDCVEPASPISLKSKVEETTAVNEPLADVETQVEPTDLDLATTANPFADSLNFPVELMVAASTPLPDFDDDDLSDGEYEDSTQNTREESIATTISEFSDEEANDESQNPNYEPTKAIVIPQYIHQSNTDEDANLAKHQDMASPGSLVMV